METLQRFLDSYAAGHPRARVDYIHGAEEAVKLAEEREWLPSPTTKSRPSRSLSAHAFLSRMARAIRSICAEVSSQPLRWPPSSIRSKS